MTSVSQSVSEVVQQTYLVGGQHWQTELLLIFLEQGGLNFKVPI